MHYGTSSHYEIIPQNVDASIGNRCHRVISPDVQIRVFMFCAAICMYQFELIGRNCWAIRELVRMGALQNFAFVLNSSRSAHENDPGLPVPSTHCQC